MSKKISLITSLLLLASVVSAQVSRPTGPVPGRFIVKISSKANLLAMKLALSSEQSLSSLSLAQPSANIVGLDNVQDWYSFVTSDTTLDANDVALLIGYSNVVSVEPDYYLEFFDWPAEEHFDKQWYLHNSGQSYLSVQEREGFYNDTLVETSGVAGIDLNVASYYDSPPPETTRVVVAIIDSGIDRDHHEFAGRLWQNNDEIPDNGLDDDHNGYIDDINGYDISGDILNILNIVGDNDPDDMVGHGSHVSGIVCANNNGAGIVGVAPWAELMAVKITPNATAAVGAAGIIYAVLSGAKVINISWGSPYESGALWDAIEFARKNDVFVCIAAGNTGNNERFFPAAFDSSFTIAAGRSDGKLAAFSTFGAHIDLVAPGEDILSVRAAGTDMHEPVGEPGVHIIGDDSLYYLADGTSMACPMVAGAAAMALSYRPDISLAELRRVLREGADDIIDPFGLGDTLYGVDTITGSGYINVTASMQLLTSSGLYFVSPSIGNRYVDPVDVKIAPVGSYSGGWILEYTTDFSDNNWQWLSSGSGLPGDSIVYSFTNGLEGHIYLRLIDDGGRKSMTNFTYISQRKVAFSSPLDGEVLKYNAVLYGSTYGPDFDSMSLSYQRGSNAVRPLYRSTGEFIDSLIYTWSASGIDTGDFKFYLHGYFGVNDVVDTLAVRVASSFTSGWPRKVASIASVSPVCTDLDHNGIKELVVATAEGLYLFDADGTLVPGFPVLPLLDVRCVPAIYDVDRDGVDEIICTNDSGIYVFNNDGTLADGWPQYCFTGAIPYNYGFPNPTVAELSHIEIIDDVPTTITDSAIMIINKAGHLLAYKFDGRSHFASLGGLFAYFDKRASNIYRQGGETSPFVTSADLDGDGATEVVASYTAPYPYAGVAVFKGKNGQPAYKYDDPLVVNVASVFGTALADLNGDDLPEIITAGLDSLDRGQIWAVTYGNQLLPGFPVEIPGVSDWIASYPVVADLDLDGSPEILITVFEFDITSLFIFRSDGTPYVTKNNRPPGEASFQQVTFATPTVANILGDDYPEIIIRSGYIFPGSGPEKLFVFDNYGELLPGWPINTPSRPNLVFSSRQAPLVDDVDSDGKVEVVLVGDGRDVMVWDFEASSNNGANRSRFLYDNLNSGYYRPNQLSTAVIDYIPADMLPNSFVLAQNFPNPFNPVTRILFDLPLKEHVQLDVFNLLGQKVTTLIDKTVKAGRHSVDFNATDLASGIYFYRLSAGETRLTKKMILLK